MRFWNGYYYYYYYYSIIILIIIIIIAGPTYCFSKTSQTETAMSEMSREMKTIETNRTVKHICLLPYIQWNVLVWNGVLSSTRLSPSCQVTGG